MWRWGKGAPMWRALAVVLAMAWMCTALVQGCSDGAFLCADNSKCIDSSLVQDGVPDCKDGSDEACRPLQFRCPCLMGADGKRGPRCLEPEMVKDGVNDCADGADEMTDVAPATEGQCPENKEPSPAANQVVRSKRRASEVSTRIDGPVTTSMFVHEGGDRRLRPTGILTSTAGTFVLDGTTTEFATKVYGTHLDGVYAKIVSTSSRVFFAVPSAGSMARIRPTGLLSSATSTRVDGTATTLYTTEFSGTYIDGTYAQLVSSTSHVMQGTASVIKPTATFSQSETYQTATPPIPVEMQHDIKGDMVDQVVTVTGTRGALVDGGETKYDVFTGTHVTGDKTYLFFFGNTALSPSATTAADGDSTATAIPSKASELVVRTGPDDRIVVNVDNTQLNLVLPKSARASAAESGAGKKDTAGTNSGMRGVFIEGSELLGGFSIQGAKDESSRADGLAPTEMLTVTVGRGVAQTRIVRGRYDGLGEKELETEIRGNVSPSRVSVESVASERTVYRFPPRIPALRPPRPSLGDLAKLKTAKENVASEATEVEESENLLKARKLDPKGEGSSLIRPSKVHRVNLPTFTVGQDGLKIEEEAKVVVRVDHNVEARVGPRKEYRTLSSRQRLGKSLPFRGFQVIHEKEDLVNAESGGSAAVPTITYVGFAEFTTTVHGTVFVFMPRSQELAPSTPSVTPKITAVSAYSRPSSKFPGLKEGPAYTANSLSGAGKQRVATGIKTFYSHTPGMVTRTVTGHSLSMQTSIPTVLVEPVFGISAKGREKNGRSEEDPSDAQLVYPTSDAPEENQTTEGKEEIDSYFIQTSISQPKDEILTSTSSFFENAHARPHSIDIDASVATMESSLSEDTAFEGEDGRVRGTEPLKPSATTLEGTETLPTGLIRSIEATRALDGTTTFFTSLIYGTFINGNYAQLIQTTTSILHEVNPTDIPSNINTDYTGVNEKEESSTDSSAETLEDDSGTTFVTKEILEHSTPAIITTVFDEDDETLSTIPGISSSTEENEIANEVETGRRVNNRPDEQVLLVEDVSKDVISAIERGTPSESNEEDSMSTKPSLLYTIIPTTVYHTYTYFTTFFIPDGDTTSTSIRSRETTSSELALLTRSYTVTPTRSVSLPSVVDTTESTSQDDFPTTPLSPVTEETPELPQDRTTTLSEELITIEPAVVASKEQLKDTDPTDEEHSSETEDEEDSEEIELIFKTLYTTYTYLTTFFHDTTTSVSSRESVVTNVLTSTLNNVNLATEPALAGLVRDHDLSTSVPSPSYHSDEEEDVPTSVGIGRPTTKFFPELDPSSNTPTTPLPSTPRVTFDNRKGTGITAGKPQLRTFYTTYTYFTTIFVDGETEISSRTEVYTNIITPSGLIQPTSTTKGNKIQKTSLNVSSLSQPNNEADLTNTLRPSVPITNPERYSSTIMRRGGVKSTEAPPGEDISKILEPRINSEVDSISNPSEHHEKKQDAENIEIQNDDPNVRFETTTSSTTTSAEMSEVNAILTTEKYVGVTKFEEAGEPEKLVSEEDDQESSESNTEIVLPIPLPSPTPSQITETSLLLQTTFTTFTYFTTLYRGGTSDVISRLDTVTNIMAITVEPTKRTSENILPTPSISTKPSSTDALLQVKTTELPESLYPITYFTTFTYWTTAYKGGSTVVNSREETSSNVVTPTAKLAITRELEITTKTPLTETVKPTRSEEVQIVPTETAEVKMSPTPDPSSPIEATPQLTTFYTTYTYFTTSYVGDSTLVNSRLETVTNVEEGDTQTARAIGASPPVQQKIITPTKTTDLPTGLLQTVRRSSVGADSRTTVFSTDVYGTYIDGRYAQVLESSTQVLVEPSSTSTPILSKVNLQPTGVVSLNAGSIVDAEGLATTYFSTMAIGTYIGDLYAQVVESTSSVVIDTAKTTLPLNTATPKTGLVRLIKGSIIKGQTTTFYESRVIGTVTNGRYAQIIESTSRFKAGEVTKTLEENSILPSATSTTILTATVAPTLESSLGEVSSSATPQKEEGEQEEGDVSEDGDGEDDSDEDDANNQGRGRVTSRLTFSSRRRTFTPVIRPFASRNRPTFHPRRRPTSATTITRVTQTPTVTATPAHSGDHPATSARGRFNNRRGSASSLDVRASATPNSRRFTRIRQSSPGGVYGSSTHFGGSRGRGTSTRIAPTTTSSLPFGGSRSRPGSYRSSFAGGGRSSSEYPYGRTTSAALFAANSRYRIRPSPTSSFLRPTQPPSSPPTFDRNTVEDEEDDSAEGDEDEDIGTEKEENTRVTEPTEGTPLETALTPTTEGTTSPFRRPLLRRRPLPYQPQVSQQTTPAPVQRTTASRRLGFLRRPSSEENLPTESRKPNRGRYKASSAATTKSPAKTPTTPRPRSSQPQRLQVLSRPRPTSSLFPRRGLFRRPGEEQEKQQAEEAAKEEESNEEEKEEIVEEAESAANEGVDEDNGDDSYSSDDSVADNDYEASEDVKSKNEPPKVFIRPFTPRRRRIRRQAEYGTRGSSNSGALRGYSNRFRRPGASRKSAPVQEAEARVGTDEDEVYVDEEYSLQSQSEVARQSSPRSRGSGQQQPRVRPTPPAAPSRTQFTITGNRNKNSNNIANSNNNNNYRETTQRTNFRRPSSTATSPRRRTKGDTTLANQQPRPKPPRLRSQSETQSTATVSAKPRSRGRYTNRGRSQATSRGRSSYRTSDLETNDYTTRRQYQSSRDGKVTVTHQVPTEATIPVVNGKNTEYRKVITASPSTQILTPGQYEATELAGIPGLLLIGSDVTATPTPGIIHVTQYIARETPTTSIEFTPTVIRGRKTSFSHIVPSTAYGVEEVVNTIPSENGLLPSAPLANILLSQLLLGQFGLQGNVNPLLGLQQPNAAAALAPPTPTTEFKTRSTTFVTTLTEKTSTVIPITLHGKAIMTTIVDSSVQVVTATEFITDTIVVTPTAAPQQQLNSLLLPALLQAQLLNQQQQPQIIQNPLPGQLTPLQAAQLFQQQQPTIPLARPEVISKDITHEEEDFDTVSPSTERRKQSSSRRRNRPHKRVEAVEDDREDDEGPRPIRGSTEENPRPKTRKKQPSSGRKQNPQQAPKQYETSVITLYVSGRRPGDFSTVLSTISIEAGSSLVKREAVSPERIATVQYVTDVPILPPPNPYPVDNYPEKFSNSLPYKDPNIYLSPSTVNFIPNPFQLHKQGGSNNAKFTLYETESLESIVGDVSKHVVQHSHPSSSTPSTGQPVSVTNEKAIAEESSSDHAHTGYFLADGPAELAPLKRKVLSIDEGVEDEDSFGEIPLMKIDLPEQRTKRDIHEGRIEEHDITNQDRTNKRRRVRVRVPIRRNNEESSEAFPAGLRTSKRLENEREELILSEDKQRTALENRQHNGKQNDLSDATRNAEYIKRGEDISLEETEAEEILKSNFPSQRVKVLRVRPRGSEENTNSGTANRGNRKRVKVLRRRKPVADGSDEPNDLTHLGRQKAEEEIGVNNGNVAITDKEVKSPEKDLHGTHGRRRVTVTKKRLLSTVPVHETLPITPESTRRHRIVVTRRRPVNRQNFQETAAQHTTHLPSKDETQEVKAISTGTPTKTITPNFQTQTKSVHSPSPPREVPTARRLPTSGVNNEDFGSKKNSIANAKDKVQDTAQKFAVLEAKEERTPAEIKESNEEETKERAEEVVTQTGEWVASLGREQYGATPPKTVEPSFWSESESFTGETELLREDPKTSIANASPDKTGATPEGPRFVRPTRFSVTRRPSGDFLQKVQGLRTKAPIVFPSRRRPSAATRQPAYRSRLSRLRGRPSSTTTNTLLETTASDVLDTTETELTTQPITSISIQPSSTAPPAPIYITETLTETLLKTYTYVVSRVESSVEAGVDQAAAAPPSLAAVSSTTEVKQVVKTRTVTRLLEPTATVSSAVPEASITKFNEKSEEGVAVGAHGRMNVEAARFNLATRVMSNGVEVIVAGDKTTLPGGPDVLRILSTASRPITLAPSTLSDQMHLTLPTALAGVGKPQGDQESLLQSLQSQAANFVTKTYATTYTYLTTFLQGSSTVVSSREDVITNVVTEEVRPTKTIQKNPGVSSSLNEALTSKVDGPPSFVTSTYRTTFTYLNTIIDGEIPVVLTTRQTVANTVTAPANPSLIGGSSGESDSGYLQPSEPTMYDTNTYFNTFTLTKTLSDSASGLKVISTEDVLTQVVITEASTPAPSIIATKISPTSTTDIIKTYFVTYTYYNTFLEKGSTVVKTNVATSSDVVTEKFYLAPSKTLTSYKTPSLTNIPITNLKDQHPIKTGEGLASALPPLSVFATKTYLTTFTYFTTLLENGQTVTRSNTKVSTNLATEAITAGLDSVYLDSLRSSFSMQSAHSPIIATVMLSGTPMEITALQGSVIETTKPASDAYGSQASQKISEIQTHEIEGSKTLNVSPSKTTSGDVVVGSTIIFFDDVLPQGSDSEYSDEPAAAASTNSEATSDDDETLHTSSSSNNIAHTDTPEFLLSSLASSPTPNDELLLGENSYISKPTKPFITSTITASTVVANGNGLSTTLVPGDAVIVSMQPDGNVSLIPVSDPSNKNPEGALIGANSGVVQSVGGTGGLLAAAPAGPNLGVGDLINLGSLSLNGLNALGPVFNAMAGLLQNNLKSSPSRQNYTTTPRPQPVTPRTPPPIDLPRPPAPQSAPLIRDPVYIPVGGLASLTSQNSDAVAAESTHGDSIESFYGQNFPIHGFPDTQERRPPPSPVKPSMPTTLTLDNPLLLQNGIPIQPGQVITTNSDVIVGKPSVLGPRPSPNGGIPQIFPQNYAPPPIPPVHSPHPPVLVPTNQPATHYLPKPAVVAPPRTRPGNDVPPEMRPPPPPRYPSYSGVNPTRVSVLSGMETVFIGKPLPPHMVPENNLPPPPHLIPHTPTIPTGPLRGEIGNYKPQIHVAPLIVIGSPLENPKPHPPLQYNHNTIDRSTGYKIQPSQSFNIPIDSVTLSVGSETSSDTHEPAESFLDVRTPLSGTRPGSVFNAGEPHSGPQLSLGQPQVHKVPVGTGGEVVVEIGRPPVTDALKPNSYSEETDIITNEDSSNENQGVVHEEEENLLSGQPTVIAHGQSEPVLHPGNIIVSQGRPPIHKPPSLSQPNYYSPPRPNLQPGSKPPPHFNHIHHPQSSVGAIHRPPPLSAVYTTGLNTHASPPDHLMPPPPPWPGTNPLTQTNIPHKNEGPIIIPLNHNIENTPQSNTHKEMIKPFTDDKIQIQWFDGADEELGEPEDVEGAQDGEVLQESNNRPVRPAQTSIHHPEDTKRPNIVHDSQKIKEKPYIPHFPSSNSDNHFQNPSNSPGEIIPIHISEINTGTHINSTKGNNDNKPPSTQHQQQFTLPEPPPYRFEIPDMQPPQLPSKTPLPTLQPPNSLRPPPGAVSRPAIRPQDYNPDFLDKPIRIASHPFAPTRAPIADAASLENAVRPEVPRPPVRVVVRPVNPHRPRPNYHNHHVSQSRPSQIWPRPLRPLKPPGPVQVLRVSSSSSRPSAWQPAFSSTSQQKEVTYTSTLPHRDILIQPTQASSLGDFNIRDTSILRKPINPPFSLEREPLVIISSPSSPEVYVESSGRPIVWEGDQFTAMPTAELPSTNIGSKITENFGPTILLSGASTIYGGLYSRPTSTKKSSVEPSVHGDLFVSPSSHGAIAGANGRPIVGHSNSSPHHYKEEEEVEHEFEEGEGLGAAGSNDAATSIVVVSVTATPTTRYITRTQTETRTVTQTVVESHPGSPPLTRTVIVTQTIAPEVARPVTIVSTIVGTVTEVHTTVEASTTTAVTTVTVTAPTQWILHTSGGYEKGQKVKDSSDNIDHSLGNLGSTSTPTNVINMHSPDANFDISFPLRPTASINKDDTLNVDFIGKGGEMISKETDEPSSYDSDVESEDNREGLATNLIPNEVPGGNENYPLCKPECDSARNEICVVEIPEEGEDGMEGPHCVCRPGFARLFPDRPCMPTYTYQLRLFLDRIGKHRLMYTTELEDPQTEEFQQLHETAQDALERVAMQSDLRDLFHGISIAAFESPAETMEMTENSKVEVESDNGHDEKLVDSNNNESHSYVLEDEDGVIVNFYVKLSDNMDPEKLKEMFEKTLKQSNYSVGGTELFARRKEGLLEIYDFDECSDPDFNDCSDQAQCLNLRGTYTCSCKEGFADLSENAEFPGRVCSAEYLGCEQCKYHGQCYTNTNGEIGCKCFQWYSGDKCQINLKVLLIALVTVGAILLILMCVCIMFACMKRKKTDIRHTAPGFMRYRGPPGMIRSGGTLDKTAMIPDTSSESSFEGALPPPPLTYLPVVHHRLSTSTQASKVKGEGIPAERRMNEVKPTPAMGTSTMNTGFTEQDRSLTVMIPRAKYRPAPPLIATAAASSPMTSFGVVVLEGENRERRVSAANEQKLLAFLDGTDTHNQGKQGSPTKQKQIGPTFSNHESSGNQKKISSSRKPSTGALVSAGFEVSATVVKDKWPTDGSGCNQLDDDVDDASGTGRVIDGHLHHTLASNGSHFTTLRTGDRTVSEARSYDETIVHPPKKSLLHSPMSACGSKPSSQHGLHHSNDEAHTMAERDVGSTFLMPQTQLYKPSRGSDNSNFDSL